MPDRNRGRSEWYRPTYLAAPFKKTARRTGIPNGTKTRAPSTCDSATNGTTALVLQQYTPEWAAAEWLHEPWGSTGQGVLYRPCLVSRFTQSTSSGSPMPFPSATGPLPRPGRPTVLGGVLR